MKVLDIFSGTGGFGLGLSQAGFEVVAFCECAEHAQRLLSKNWPDTPIHPDIKKLNKKWLESNDLTFRAMCGGFPCSDISIGGHGAGIENGENSKLWKDYCKKIAAFRPEYAFIENVSALLHRGLDIVLHDLAKIGYDACWTTLDSQYSGVPQRRRRVYIVAVRDGIPRTSDIFRFKERSSDKIRQEIRNIEESRCWNFKKGKYGKGWFAYYTRQRSDQFDCLGVASTLLKRDYKDFTDLIVDSSGIRRVAPSERLLLQGYTEDYFEGAGLTNTEQYMLNGMTVPVVKWLGECVLAFDKKVRRNKTKNVIDFTDYNWSFIDSKLSKLGKYKRDKNKCRIRFDGVPCEFDILSCTLKNGNPSLNCISSVGTFSLRLYKSKHGRLVRTLRTLAKRTYAQAKKRL